MKSRDKAASALIRHALEAMAHLSRRFIGERHRKDFPGTNSGFDKVGNSRCNNSGLSRPSPGEYDHRTISVQHGVALHFIQPLKNFFDSLGAVEERCIFVLPVVLQSSTPNIIGFFEKHSSGKALFHGHRLGEISWLINIRAAFYSDVICQKLQRNH